MYPNKEMEQHRIVVNTPGERRETVTARTEAGPREVSMSPGTIAVIVLLAIIAIGLTFYVVSNKNANEAANRQAQIEAAQQQNQQQAPPPAVVPQPQPPVIVQQPAPPAQAPVIVQQPPAQPSTKESSSVVDDTTIQELASKRLTDDSSLATLTVTVINGRAMLTGTVDTPELKARAERVVKGVRGVKSVDNKIVVLNP
jgi:osmotically-inducible protein OsmY